MCTLPGYRCLRSLQQRNHCHPPQRLTWFLKDSSTLCPRVPKSTSIKAERVVPEPSSDSWGSGLNLSVLLTSPEGRYDLSWFGFLPFISFMWVAKGCSFSCVTHHLSDWSKNPGDLFTMHDPWQGPRLWMGRSRVSWETSCQYSKHSCYKVFESIALSSSSQERGWQNFF